MNSRESIRLFLLKNKARWEDESACFIIDTKKLVSEITALKESLKGEIVYSHKTNPDFNVAEIVASQGCGFLFSSVEELENIAKLACFEKDKNIFQSPSLTKNQFLRIRELGITRFVVDSQDQLGLMLKNMSGGEVIDLFIRVNTGIEVNKPELSYGMDSYLGFPMAEAMSVLKYLNPLREENKVRLGIHNHLISQNTDLDMWEKNTQLMADFVDDLKKENVQIDFVDFGGGYPIEYSKPVPELSAIGNIVYKAQERMTDAFPDMKYIFEPGRKLIGESVALIGKIVHIKKFLHKKIVILGCSLYNCSMDTLIVDLFLTAIKLDCGGDNRGLDKENYIIRGSTPDSLDVFSRGVELPQLRKGDFLAFLHAGAYSFGSEFISLSKPKNIIV